MEKILNAFDAARICADLLSISIDDNSRIVKYDSSYIECYDRNSTVIVKSSCMDKKQALYKGKTSMARARVLLLDFVQQHILKYESKINDDELHPRIKRMKTAMHNITGKKYKSRFIPKTNSLKLYQLHNGNRQFMIHVNLVTGDRSASIADIKMFRFHSSTEFDTIDGVCEKVVKYINELTEEIKIVHSIIEEHLMSDVYSLTLRKYYISNIVTTASSMMDSSR